MRSLGGVLLLAVVSAGSEVSRQAEVDRIFAAYNTHTPGCAVGVAQKGTVVLRAGYGMADLERNVTITPETVFESGSVAKQFTAAALMLLEQQGKISLDDPLRKHLPELPEYGVDPTIRHVLSHVSGLRDWRAIAEFGGYPEGTYVYSNHDLLQMAARQRELNFEPGTDYSYSNMGYNIAAIIFERVLDGKTFQTFTRERMFGPLGMSQTRWRDDFRAVVPNRALAYRRSSGGWVHQTPIENIIGAGGLLTTVGDLLLWNENFTHARVGGHKFVKAQQIPATLKGGRAIAYAAGLTIGAFSGLREVSHGGSTGGYRTWLGRYPDQGVSVAVLCNSAQANAASLGRETARLWTGAIATKAPASSYTADPAAMERLAGMYRKVRDNTVSELRWRNGRLVLGGTELTALAAGKFLASEQKFQFEEGPPVRFRAITPNGEVVYERVEPAQPAAEEIAAFAGQYESRETGTTLTVAGGMRPAELIYRVGSEKPVALRATFRDVFETPSGTSIRFVRDAAGKVISLSVGQDRVWDLRFMRIR